MASVRSFIDRIGTEEDVSLKNATDVEKGDSVEKADSHVEWEPLWLSLLTRPWSALTVIGSDTSADVSRVADVLASVGNRQGARSVRVVSALRATTPPEVQDIVKQLSDAPTAGDLILVPCDPLQANPAMLPILHATSGVVLVVRLGESRIASARKTVSTIGRDKLFATVTIG
jgi:hypothetical protein